MGNDRDYLKGWKCLRLNEEMAPICEGFERSLRGLERGRRAAARMCEWRKKSGGGWVGPSLLMTKGVG